MDRPVLALGVDGEPERLPYVQEQLALVIRHQFVGNEVSVLVENDVREQFHFMSALAHVEPVVVGEEQTEDGAGVALRQFIDLVLLHHAQEYLLAGVAKLHRDALVDYLDGFCGFTISL